MVIYLILPWVHLNKSEGQFIHPKRRHLKLYRQGCAYSSMWFESRVTKSILFQKIAAPTGIWSSYKTALVAILYRCWILSNNMLETTALLNTDPNLIIILINKSKLLSTSSYRQPSFFSSYFWLHKSRFWIIVFQWLFLLWIFSVHFIILVQENCAQ